MGILSLAQQLPPAVISALKLLTLVYLGVEVVFYFIYHYYLLPRANQRTAPAPYRDYGDQGERHKLLFRLLERVKHGAIQSNVDVREALADCLIAWFDQAENGEAKVQLSARAKARLLERNKTKWESSLVSNDIPAVPERNSDPVPPAALLRGLSAATGYSFTSNDSSVMSDEEDRDSGKEQALNTANNLETDKWMMEGLWEENAGTFMAWALFGKEVDDLEEWEEDELLMCETKADNEHGLIFPQDLNKIPPSVAIVRGPKASPPPCKKGKQPILDPRLLSLEDLRAMHRPLAVYLGVIALKMAGGLLLRCLGFERMIFNGIVTWYRPSSDEPRQERLHPLLFFHGIAPGGHTMYLPMLLGGIVTERRRAVAIFENPCISTQIGFKGIAETETVAAVEEFVETCLDKGTTAKQKFAIAGHSFGSCPITWLVHSSLRERIGQIMLLDPVTLLLSEPSVMTNFLYKQEVNYIRVAAASELFTEYYLRRHFSWYNSELWLEDLPADVPVTIALSGGDEIVDAPAVRTHVLRHKQENKCENINVIYWEDAVHASCVMFPFKWRQIRKAMLQQELTSVQQHG